MILPGKLTEEYIKAAKARGVKEIRYRKRVFSVKDLLDAIERERVSGAERVRGEPEKLEQRDDSGDSGSSGKRGEQSSESRKRQSSILEKP